MHKIGIIGAGFVGTAVEEGLQSVAEVHIHDKFKDSESLETVVDNSNILFICVPTPMDEFHGNCNTYIVEEVSDKINSAADSRKIIVLKSINR